MLNFSKWLPVFTVFISGLCLAGYISIDTLNLNVHLLVVLFWFAFFAYSQLCF